MISATEVRPSITLTSAHRTLPTSHRTLARFLFLGYFVTLTARPIMAGLYYDLAASTVDYIGSVSRQIPFRFVGAAAGAAGASFYRSLGATTSSGLSTGRRFTGGRRTTRRRYTPRRGSFKRYNRSRQAAFRRRTRAPRRRYRR